VSIVVSSFNSFVAATPKTEIVKEKQENLSPTATTEPSVKETIIEIEGFDYGTKII